MFKSPAAAVTTRVLQKARRSAERKRPPRSLSNTKVAAQHIGFDQESKSPTSDISIQPNQIAPVQSYGAKKHICCRLGYSSARIDEILRHLPLSVHDSVARISFDCSPLGHCVGSKQACPSSGLRVKKANALLENPLRPRLVVAFEISTMQKRGIKINGAMEHLLNMDENDLRNTRYDLDFLFCDLDCVCLYLCELLQDFIAPFSPRIKYTRLTNESNYNGQRSLVRWCSHSILPSNSTILEVRLLSDLSN